MYKLQVSLLFNTSLVPSQSHARDTVVTFVIDITRFKLIEIPPTNQHILHTH